MTTWSLTWLDLGRIFIIYGGCGKILKYMAVLEVWKFGNKIENFEIITDENEWTKDDMGRRELLKVWYPKIWQPILETNNSSN